jgi:HemY protein
VILRALRYLIVLGALIAAAVWLADHPGSVTLTWQGYRIDTSVAVLVVAVAAVAATAALLYRAWVLVRRAPSDLSESWRLKRRQKGYQALTRGMVAVAAGDAEEARRQVKRADGLLDEPPLTMLLKAQAAQLAGDEQAAAKFFQAMMANPGTEFLGVRGLLNQAMRRGETEKALELARRAYRLRPKSDWVAGVLFDLEARSRRWLDARTTADESSRRGLIAPEAGRRRRAVLALELSREAKERNVADEALRHAREAHELAPDFAPATIALASGLLATGKGRRAIGLIERTWPLAPHPDLARLHGAALGDTDVLARVRATQRLIEGNPDHLESRLALAAATLQAKLWGEARTALGGIGNDPPARVCRLMAEIEEQEHGDHAQARAWLMRASLADPDPAWVCDTCGNTVKDWGALCPKCQSFDSFRWRTPPHAIALAAPVAPVPSTALPVAADPTLAPPANR